MVVCAELCEILALMHLLAYLQWLSLNYRYIFFVSRRHHSCFLSNHLHGLF